MLNATYGEGSSNSPIILERVRCTGRELRLFDCGSRGILVSSCGHSEDAGVSCVPGMNYL